IVAFYAQFCQQLTYYFLFFSRFFVQIVDFSSERKKLKPLEAVGWKGVFWSFWHSALKGGS
ncbi:hypothetical protein, partial [Streptococcus suis]|uniref:hypothetical protein n=1 Tax=Streptococcus suis TaxID=1307 RepID=UPI001E54CF01